MQSFSDIFTEHIHRDDILVLAISGGVDSMVMLDLVTKIHPKEKIIVVHFDHSLRGAESDGDRELVANICNSGNIAFEVKKMNIGNLADTEKMSIEAIARRERYTFFEDIRVKYNARHILTAHHASDQLETVLLNLTKGGKLRGLSGMSLISGYVFRPLLRTSKMDILTYQKEHDIVFREDSSNTDTTYERNKIRHDIVPTLFALNPTIDETVGELALYMQEASEFQRESAEKWLVSAGEESGKERSFLKSSFERLSPFFRGEIISYLYSEAQGGSTHGLSHGLIDELTRFILGTHSYGKKEIKNLCMERRGERIFIYDHCRG